MDVTLIIPLDEGIVDLDGYISSGIRVIAGRLTEEQLLKITEEPAYRRRAIVRCRDHKGQLTGLHVTFCNYDNEPIKQHDGEVYNDEVSGTGHLSYETRYVTVEDGPH
jgi:hypothetical protein